MQVMVGHYTLENAVIIELHRATRNASPRLLSLYWETGVLYEYVEEYLKKLGISIPEK